MPSEPASPPGPEPADPRAPENAKLVTLARAARARTGAAEGAAVRDTDGRTYAAASVALPSLRLSALEVAVAMAASSAAEDLEAAVVVTEAPGMDESQVAVVRDLGPDATVWFADPAGVVRSVSAVGSAKAHVDR